MIRSCGRIYPRAYCRSVSAYHLLLPALRLRLLRKTPLTPPPRFNAQPLNGLPPFLPFPELLLTAIPKVPLIQHHSSPSYGGWPPRFRLAAWRMARILPYLVQSMTTPPEEMVGSELIRTLFKLLTTRKQSLSLEKYLSGVNVIANFQSPCTT